MEGSETSFLAEVAEWSSCLAKGTSWLAEAEAAAEIPRADKVAEPAVAEAWGLIGDRGGPFGERALRIYSASLGSLVEDGPPA